MKIKELLDKDNNNLGHELLERQKHMFDLRTQAVTEKLEDPSQLRKTRKEIAQIQTILRQRQIDQQAQSQPGEPKTPGAKAESKPGDRHPGKGSSTSRATRKSAGKARVEAKAEVKV